MKFKKIFASSKAFFNGEDLWRVVQCMWKKKEKSKWPKMPFIPTANVILRSFIQVGNIAAL